MKGIRQLIQSVLESGFLMSLATVDDGGVWVSDVIYVHDNDFIIYWISDVTTRHSKAILKNDRVAGTITVSNDPGEKIIGLQFEGMAEKIEGDIVEMAKKHRLKRGKPAPTREREVLEEDESWYRLKPKKIELIYEPLWGFDKKTLELK